MAHGLVPINRTRAHPTGLLRVTIWWQELPGGPIYEDIFDTDKVETLADQIRARTGRSCIDADLVWDVEYARI
jgi:hypothetical protein